MAESKCARKGCENGGGWRPVLIFHAPIYLRTREYRPVEATLGIEVCEEHMKTGTAEDFISDEGWEQIVGALGRAGKVAPRRELSEIRFIRLD